MLTVNGFGRSKELTSEEIGVIVVYRYKTHRLRKTMTRKTDSKNKNRIVEETDLAETDNGKSSKENEKGIKSHRRRRARLR